MATVPDLASIAKEIGKEKIEVTSLSKGYQDPHFVDPKPSFVLKLSKADLLLLVGMDLEVGWLPVLVTGSRNSKISSPNSSGYVDCSKFIHKKLEVSRHIINRGMGDVHPHGNPHYLLDPRNGLEVAKGLTRKFLKLDPQNSYYYLNNYSLFKEKLLSSIDKWEYDLINYRGYRVITYHKTWSYFFNWLGFVNIDTIEPKPGIPPSPSHVAKLIQRANYTDTKIVISANYFPQKTGKIISKKIGASFLSLPAMVGGSKEATSYIELLDYIIKEIKAL